MKFRKVSILALCCSFVLAGQGYAHQTPDDRNSALKNRIVRLIEQPDLTPLQGDTFYANIEFIITRKNEVLVVAVTTNDTFFDTYIKEKLNYSPVKVRGIQHMTPYRIQVNFHRPSPDDPHRENDMAVVSWR